MNEAIEKILRDTWNDGCIRGVEWVLDALSSVIADEALFILNDKDALGAFKTAFKERMGKMK